jgi:hypothetical protein
MLQIVLFKLRPNIIHAAFLCLVITGCQQCDPTSQVNNFTSTPKEHVYQISGTNVAAALTTLLKPVMAYCDPSQDFRARVIAQVRTASLVNNQLVADPNPYREIDDIFVFEKDRGFNSPGAKIPIEVPERGAYAIIMTIELLECNNCCNGFTTIDCSSVKINCNNGDCICKSGKPKFAFEQIFRVEERPDIRNSAGVNFTISNNSLQVRKCFSCSTCETPCKQ